MERNEQSAELKSEQLHSYQQRGYCFPIRAFDDSETSNFRSHFDDYYAYHAQQLKSLPANKHVSIYAHTHTFLRWVYQMIAHPRVLDAVESVLGPNLMVRDSGWFVKNALETRKYVFLASGWNILGPSPP